MHGDDHSARNMPQREWGKARRHWLIPPWGTLLRAVDTIQHHAARLVVARDDLVERLLVDL